MHKNNWIWFITYWVGRQSNEITFWNEKEILNVSFYFLSLFFFLLLQIISSNGANRFKNESATSRDGLKVCLCPVHFQWDHNERFATSRCGISSLCKRWLYVFCLSVDSFSMGSWFIDAKPYRSQIKWNLRECYYVIKNILKRTIVGKPQMICRRYTKKVGGRERKKPNKLSCKLSWKTKKRNNTNKSKAKTGIHHQRTTLTGNFVFET